MFFYSTNLVTQSVSPLEGPWDFKPTENITKQIRFVKQDRQAWYNNEDTKHCFYTGLEGINPNMRISKENPPHQLHAFVADYDTEIPDIRIDEVIATMSVKPTWVETSLGRNRRLVWLLVRPLPIESDDFYRFMADRAVSWLELNKLPALDQNAFTTANRLYCNGCEWKATGHAPLQAREVQPFFVECGLKFDYKPDGDDRIVPLDVVEAELKKVYPGYTWPNNFEVNSQGPTFWIPESTSPLSAIVKNGGIFTYAAHATKPFYSWSDLLGKEFASKFNRDAIAKAVEGVYVNGVEYYLPINNKFQFEKESAVQRHMRVAHKLTTKPGPDGVSQVDKAMEYIHQHQRVDGIAPHAFYRPGPIRLDNGETHLNIYSGKPIEPAVGGNPKWGPHGDFPFLSASADHLLRLNPEQFENWLAHLHLFYCSVLDYSPMPGQISIYSGERGNGKTFWNRHVIGYSVGGFVDASRYLIQSTEFTAHLFNSGYWACDDENPGTSESARNHVQKILKSLAANQEHVYHKKYGLPTTVPWCGRLGITTNLDYLSTQIVNIGDAGDKIHLWKCNQTPYSFQFPSRKEQLRLRNVEVPYFLRYLVDYKIPDSIEKDSRYGMKAYKDDSMILHVQQASPMAPFREVLIAALERWFVENPDDKTWKGAAIHVLSLVNSDPSRMMGGGPSYKASYVNYALEQMHRDKLMNCKTETGRHNIRFWIFERPSDLPQPNQPSPEAPSPSGEGSFNPFSK